MLTGGGDAVDFGVRATSPVKHIIESVKWHLQKIESWRFKRQKIIMDLR
jgi:hypothetical protein